MQINPFSAVRFAAQYQDAVAAAKDTLRDALTQQGLTQGKDYRLVGVNQGSFKLVRIFVSAADMATVSPKIQAAFTQMGLKDRQEPSQYNPSQMVTYKADDNGVLFTVMQDSAGGAARI